MKVLLISTSLLSESEPVADLPVLHLARRKIEMNVSFGRDRDESTIGETARSMNPNFVVEWGRRLVLLSARTVPAFAQ